MKNVTVTLARRDMRSVHASPLPGRARACRGFVGGASCEQRIGAPWTAGRRSTPLSRPVLALKLTDENGNAPTRDQLYDR